MMGMYKGTHLSMTGMLGYSLGYDGYVLGYSLVYDGYVLGYSFVYDRYV